METIASLVVGATLAAFGAAVAYFFGWLSHRRDRAELVADRNRAERLGAYAAFLEAVNNAAHRIGNLSDNPYGDRAADRQAAAYLFDQNVTPRMLTLRLVGTEEAVEAARLVHETLRSFRDGMTTRDDPPVYESLEYMSLYGPVRAAREAFIKISNDELRGG